MLLSPLPTAASWTHRGVRVGFEVLFAGAGRLRGRTSAREDGTTWYVGYDITVGSDRATATFDFECELTFDAAGLVLDYPGIATRDR